MKILTNSLVPRSGESGELDHPFGPFQQKPQGDHSPVMGQLRHFLGGTNLCCTFGYLGSLPRALR